MSERMMKGMEEDRKTMTATMTEHDLGDGFLNRQPLWSPAS